MAIFDIFEEVTEKNVIKTETGDPRIFGVLVGEVTNNYSIDMPGRVCVSIHVRDKEANVLKWARVAMMSSGTEWGHYFLPEVGDQVLVAFDQGIIDEPYVIGCIPKDKNKFLKGSTHKDNIYKKIVTKHGSTIMFQDGSKMSEGAEDGSNDKIKIYTAGEGHVIELDNETHTIKISAEEENNASIIMKTMDGKITVTGGTNITLSAGENASITMNGATGQITIKGMGIVLDSTGKIILKGTGNAELSGATMSIKSQAKLSMSASGPMSLEGKPVKIG